MLKGWKNYFFVGKEVIAEFIVCFAILIFWFVSVILFPIYYAIDGWIFKAKMKKKVKRIFKEGGRK